MNKMGGNVIVTEADISYNAGKKETQEKYDKIIAEKDEVIAKKDAIIAQLTLQLQAK